MTLLLVTREQSTKHMYCHCSHWTHVGSSSAHSGRHICEFPAWGCVCRKLIRLLSIIACVGDSYNGFLGIRLCHCAIEFGDIFQCNAPILFSRLCTFNNLSVRIIVIFVRRLDLESWTDVFQHTLHACSNNARQRHTHDLVLRILRIIGLVPLSPTILRQFKILRIPKAGHALCREFLEF